MVKEHWSVTLTSILFVHLQVFVAGGSLKTGVCPYLPPPTYCRDNHDLCNNDNDCPIVNFKCCSNGCKKICAVSVSKRLTVPSSVPFERSRPGKCPLLSIPKYCISGLKGCSSDFDCKDQFKCCSNGCVKRCFLATAKKAVESGIEKNVTCPHFPTNNTNCPARSTDQCNSDTNCRDQGRSVKCCWDGCRKICLNPSEVQQTEDISFLMCPIARRPERCPENTPSMCTSNKHCERSQKCCYDGCQYRCFGRAGFSEEISDSPLVIKPLLTSAEVVFVMDTSDGPTLEEFELQKSFTTSLTHYFELGRNKVRVAIVTSDQNTRIVKYLSPYVTQADFESYMVRLYKQGGRRDLSLVFDVIESKVLSAARTNVPQIVIIFSFGLPTSSAFSLLTSVRSLQSVGVKVFTIGIDVQDDEAQLRALVYRSTDLFAFHSVYQLENLEGSFASHIASRADPEAVPDNFNADLIFLLDSSNSVGRANFTKIKHFVASLSRLLNLEPTKTRVSVVTFGDVVAEIAATFGQHSSVSELSSALNWLVFLGGHARIERALEKTQDLLGRSRNGVRKVAVMVTDSNYLAGEIQPLNQTMLPLQKRGLEMVALVIGGDQNNTRRLAGLTTRSTDIFTATSYDDLPNLLPPIAKYIAHGPPPTTVRPTTTAQPTTAAKTTAPKTVATPIPRQPTPYFTRPDATTFQPTTTKTLKNQEKHRTDIKYVAAGNRPTEASLNKPGKCPAITRQGGACIPQKRCFSDRDCNGDGKCCSDGCIISCVKPAADISVQNAPARDAPKPGICPMVSRLGILCPTNDQCKTDRDCTGKKKCCIHFCRRLVCVDPPSKEEERRLMNQLYRTGKCPVLNRPTVCQTISKIECNYDVDCPQPKKCCSDGCHRRCVNALGGPGSTGTGGGGGATDSPIQGTRPGFVEGRCPPYSPVRKCPALVQDACTCNSDCNNGFKCCYDGCKRICRRPAGQVCASQVDIVYLMDTSGSISSDDYRREKQFVKDLARIFRIDTDASHAAAIIYNDDPFVMIKLGDHRSTDDFAKAVDAIPYLHGRTRIDKALKASTEVFRNARATVQKVLVVLTDGRQTKDPDAVSLDVASKPLKDMGVKIYAVGVGHKIDLEELKNITNDPEDVFTVDSFTALLGESQSIAEKACGDISGKLCLQGVDLGFIVDSSESINDDDFTREKNAIKAISDEFIIAPQNTRVGVVLYSGEPHVSISFNQYTSNPDFNRAVNKLPHMQSHTRLDKALRYAASHLYNKRRTGNPSIAIVMTDGKQTPGAEPLAAAVQPLRDLGVRVFAVGVGPRVPQSELRELVERYEDIFTVDSFAQLIEEAKKVTKKACPAPAQTILPSVTAAATFPTYSSTSSPTLPSTTSPISSPSPPTPSLLPTPGPIKCANFLDIIFVMDSSRSMDVRAYERQKEFVKKLATLFNVGQGSRAAVIIYSDDPVLSIDFEKFNTLKDFLKGIDDLPYIMLRTRIDKALRMASEVLLDSRPGFPKAVIIMTDGRQTRDPDYIPLNISAAPLHDAGARVLVVGIGSDISAVELTMMVNNPSDVFTVKSFDSLVNAASDVAIKSCQGPFPTRFPDTCSETFDLAFAMDSSGSMLISSYNKEKEFVKHVAGRLVVGPQQVMLGLLVFSDQPRVLVNFASQESVSLDYFDAAVDNAPYIRGRTRIDRALQAASTLFYGGRPGVPKILVFLTDGRQSLDQRVQPLEEAVKPLVAQNVKMIVVGIGQEIDRNQLIILANGQGRDITQIGSFDDLDKLKNSFSQTICRKAEEVIRSGSL